MPPPSGYTVVMADVIVAALTLAIVFALAMLCWITFRLTVRAAARIRPARPRPARVTAELGADGRDSGRTRIGG